jgi:hypothetical protein
VDLCDEPADPGPLIRSDPPPRSSCIIDISLDDDDDDDDDTVYLPLSDGDSDGSDEVEIIGYGSSSRVIAPSVSVHPAVTEGSTCLPDSTTEVSEQPSEPHGETGTATSSSAVVDVTVPLHVDDAQGESSIELLAAPPTVAAGPSLQSAEPQDPIDLSVSKSESVSSMPLLSTSNCTSSSTSSAHPTISVPVPVRASKAETLLPIVPEFDGRIVLVSILQDVIEKSGLIGLLDSYLRNESLVDIENHSDLYYLIFQVRCRLTLRDK